MAGELIVAGGWATDAQNINTKTTMMTVTPPTLPQPWWLVDDSGQWPTGDSGRWPTSDSG